MRQLRFVAPTEDGGHLLVETTDGLEQFALGLDAPLRAAACAPEVRPAVPAAATPAAPTAPTVPTTPAVPAAPLPAAVRVVTEEIGPREIQMRVRAGESPQQVADAQGMTLEKVLRFAAPVMAERERITVEARRARARRTGTEGSEARIVAFGEAVDERFGAYGIDAATIGWDSRRRDDGEWIVTAAWIGGDGEHAAEWVFHRASRTATPLDDAAADLLSDRPIRPVAPPPPPTPAERMAAPHLAPGVIAFPPLPDANTGPVRTVEHVFDQEAPPEGPRELPPYQAPAPAPAWARLDPPADLPTVDLRTPPVEFEEPPLPLAISDAEGRPEAAATVPALGTLRSLGTHRRGAESEEEKAARARVPSWDDILLGVRRKSD